MTDLGKCLHGAGENRDTAWRIGYDDCETSSYRIKMVEVMIMNQDIIYNLTLFINLLNLKTDTDSYILFIYFVIIFIVLFIIIAYISLWGALPMVEAPKLLRSFNSVFLQYFKYITIARLHGERIHNYIG